ncbi:hypothetical protein [Chromobacterium violaceum]|uniref:hypothetical protein n=1 Tax=Chromobacterium violaceum TaxID=536 RepID=UPI0012D2B7FD|nr:hypothetical protein [Chromobacterium violaceum]
MSDTIDDYRALKDHTKRLRAKYGVPCPRCKQYRPRAHPSILLPQQKCRVDGYRDPRPRLTNEEWSQA